MGLGAGDEFADDGVASLELGGGVQQPGLQLTDGDRSAGESGDAVPVESERVGAARQQREGAFQGVERRVGEGTAAVGHGWLLSFRSPDRATPCPPLFPRIIPNRPGRGTAPNPGESRGSRTTLDALYLLNGAG